MFNCNLFFCSIVTNGIALQFRRDKSLSQKLHYYSQSGKSAVLLMESALTSHGSSKSNKNPSDGRGIEFKSFRPLVKWHLVKSAPALVNSAPVDSRFDIYRVCTIIISQNNNDGLGVGFIVFPSTCTLQQQRFKLNEIVKIN